MTSQPDQPAHPGYRVLFYVRVRPGQQEQFLEAYEKIRWQAAAVDGHVVDQLCQSTADPDQWLITSEWREPEDFLSWERSEGHRELAAPLVACVEESRSERFVVRRETAIPPRER